MAEHWSSLWDWRKKWWTRCTFSFVLESIDSAASMSITTSDSSWQKLHLSDIHAMSLRNLLHETWKVNRIFWEIHANGNCPHSIDRYAISSSSSTKCLSFFMPCKLSISLLHHEMTIDDLFGCTNTVLENPKNHWRDWKLLWKLGKYVLANRRENFNCPIFIFKMKRFRTLCAMCLSTLHL